MRYTKSRWVASFKDTFSLDHSLSPIIGAGLVRFKEEITKEGKYRKGLPCTWISDKVEDGTFTYEGDERNCQLSEDDWEKCHLLWLDMLDEVIYAFTVPEPDIMKYDFSFDRETGEPDENGCIPVTLDCTNEEEHERYNKDMKDHTERCQKGYELFGKWFSTFWW